MKFLLVSTFILLGLNSIVGEFICITDGLFANPDDKHSYFQCSFGTHFLTQCPADLIWSQEKYNCISNTPQRKYFVKKSNNKFVYFSFN
jgi:hypothetical protein